MVPVGEPVAWSLRAARAWRAELLRRIVEVDPLICPQYQGVSGLPLPTLLGGTRIPTMSSFCVPPKIAVTLFHQLAGTDKGSVRR